MSNYEGKLGEWLKYLQQQVESVEKPEEEEQKEAPKKPEPEARRVEPPTAVDDIAVRDRIDRSSAVEAFDVEPDSVVGDYRLIHDRSRPADRGASLFDDEEIPDVEDFLPFLKEDAKPAPRPAPEPAREPEQPSVSNRLDHLVEGTGEPRPIIRKPEPAPVVEPEAKVEPPAPVETKPEVQVEKPTVAAPKPKPVARQRRQVAPPVEGPANVAELWNQLPRHVQLLIGQPQQEVAQRSYKEFKETRSELIARLLDPIISLEEAARILNVCPTTVRRYTNRGVLKHIRTEGNQRRFKLSDILEFLESSGRPGAGSKGEDTN